jgi:hypothetical protein
VLGVLVCAGGGNVVLRHPRASKVGDTRRAGGVRTLDGLGDSVHTVGEAEADVATSTRSLGGRWLSVDGWLCCVRLGLGCVELCCVMLCWVLCRVDGVVWCCVLC